MLALLLLACVGGDDTELRRARPGRPALDDTAADQDPLDDTGEPYADSGTTDTADTGGAGGDDTADPGDTADPEDSGIEDEPCPEGMTCVESFPFRDDDDTSASPRSDFDAYGCAPGTDESGPEVVYRVTVPEEGFLSASVLDDASGVDVHVHVLGSLDPDDCEDRGHYDAGAYVGAGVWYVVVDSWASGSTVYDGEYTVRIGFTGVSDHAASGLDPAVADDALYAFDVGWDNGDTESLVYTVVDFSLPSTDPRFFVLDLAEGDLLFDLYTTHGENSADPDDPRWAVEFSNVDGSHMSSLGMMQLGSTYTGDYGYSVRLHGLEAGYNDNVYSRAIVVHPWYYARPEIAATYGYLGLSWGCLALDNRESDDIIDTIADGTLLLSWFDDGDWSRRSDYLS